MSEAAELPDLLRHIAAHRRRAVEGLPAALLHVSEGRVAPLTATENSFLEALAARRGEAIIAEVKLGSPRLGDLSDRIDPEGLAITYAACGAAALSVVVEPEFFHGSYELVHVCAATGLPVLAKDFVVDARQLPVAAASGASAVLLIAALHPARRLAELAAAARGLDLAPLVEIHSEADLAKLEGSEWELVGFNHRDLRDFSVDLERSAPFLPQLPEEALLVAESGIMGREDLQQLAAAGFDAFLVGEALVTAADPGEALRSLRGEGGTRE